MRCTVLTLLTAAQVLMNQEVILTEICLVQFMLVVCLQRSLLKHVESYKIIVLAVLFAIVNLGFFMVNE